MADLVIVLPPGNTPSVLVDGRLWMATDGLRVRTAGLTKLLANVGTKDAFVLPVGTDKWATSVE
jgi:hypothetical protein